MLGMSISVFFADDHAGFRATLRDLIAATPGFVLVGEASSGADAVALVPQLRPDLVLMDVHMPGMSGFEAASRLASRHSEILIVLMSADPITQLPTGVARSADLDFVMKQEMSRRRLLDLWHGRRRPRLTAEEDILTKGSGSEIGC